MRLRLWPKDKDRLLRALRGQPLDRSVEVDADTGIAAKTVQDLVSLPAWQGGFVLDVPSEQHRDLTIKISRATK
jgi:hypothetical protein